VRISNALNLSALLRLGVCLDNARPIAVETPEQLPHHVSLFHARFRSECGNKLFRRDTRLSKNSGKSANLDLAVVGNDTAM